MLHLPDTRNSTDTYQYLPESSAERCAKALWPIPGRNGPLQSNEWRHHPRVNFSRMWLVEKKSLFLSLFPLLSSLWWELVHARAKLQRFWLGIVKSFLFLFVVHASNLRSYNFSGVLGEVEKFHRQMLCGIADWVNAWNYEIPWLDNDWCDNGELWLAMCATRLVYRRSADFRKCLWL